MKISSDHARKFPPIKRSAVLSLVLATITTAAVAVTLAHPAANGQKAPAAMFAGLVSFSAALAALAAVAAVDVAD